MMQKLSIWITGHDLSAYRPGLGPNAAGLWRILLPYSGLFYEPSIEHDLRYCLGGNEEDLRIANEVLFAECRALSKNLLQKSFANIYYLLVKSYGYKFFNYTIG